MKKLETLQDVLRAVADNLDGKGSIVQYKVEEDRLGRGTDWNDYTKEVVQEFHKFTKFRLKPQPKYRPWTPEEAFKHLDCEIYDQYEQTLYCITAIRLDGVILSNPSKKDKHCTFLHLLNGNYILKHSGKPCGTEVEG